MLSSKLKTLYNLCQAKVSFNSSWSKECEDTFQLSKTFITSDSVLAHYNPSLPIYVTTDASGFGIGAVLSHKINGVERPVMFMSSTLSKAEQKYSNLELEPLAIICSAKFHKYLSQIFVLITDHQPLQYIFGRNKGIPVKAASRIMRWAITLSGYQYDIQYKKGSLISNADALSRLPANNSTEVSDCLFSFFNRRLELSVEQNCILLGNKVVIPKSLVLEVLKLLHEQHIGIVRTKMLIRSNCWWPTINTYIEKFISSCNICQEHRNFSNSTPLIPWPSAPHSFFRVHIDFFVKWKYVFLILVDQKSKSIEVKLMKNDTSSLETISNLKEIFAVFGFQMSWFQLMDHHLIHMNLFLFAKLMESHL